MNLVLVRPDEHVAPDEVRLVGARARHVSMVIGATPGDSLRIGIPDGPRGVATVVAADDGRVVLAIDHLDSPPPPVPRIDLILAMPRPKVLGRILEHVVALGVGRIALTRSWRVEKSYFQTERLEAREIENRVWAGLEQACDTRIPEVRVFDRFRPFVEDDLEGFFPDSRRLVAHPGGATRLADVDLAAERAVVAVGPEGGWIPFELELLESRGFTPISLGERVLRVETACTTVFAQLQLLLG